MRLFLLTLAATIVSAALTPVLLKVFADLSPDLKVDLLRYPELLLFERPLIIFNEPCQHLPGAGAPVTSRLRCIENVAVPPPPGPAAGPGSGVC